MLLLALALSACGVATASAAPPSGLALPELTGHVVDNAGLLPPEAERGIAMRSAQLERETGHQFVVVTLPDLQGATIEAMGLALGNGWGIGRKAVDDGVLLIVAPKQRKVRIEVGCGLEAALTDAEARGIIDRDILPAFRRNDFVGGVQGGVEAVLREVGSGILP